MDNSDLLLIILIVVLGGLVAWLLIVLLDTSKAEVVIKNIKATDRPDLIQDDKVTIALVQEKLKDFKIEIVKGRKGGFTEKDYQKQLEKYFKDIFQTVTMEHGIESKNAKAIDLDIGNGKVGIEAKLASAILKEGGWDRAIGQMVKYVRLKYHNDNLIFAIAGFEDDLRNSMLSEFEDDVVHNKCKFCFINAGNKKNITLD